MTEAIKSGDTIIVTEFDLRRIKNEVAVFCPDSNLEEKNNFNELLKELVNVEVVLSEEIPSDVITLNSMVRIMDMKSKEKDVCTLVFPIDEDITENAVSILSPIGRALLGNKVQDVIKLKVPAGTLQIKVEELIYQPERAKDYHL